MHAGDRRGVAGPGRRLQVAALAPLRVSLTGVAGTLFVLALSAVPLRGPLAAADRPSPPTPEQRLEQLFLLRPAATISALVAVGAGLPVEDRYRYITVGLELAASAPERAAALAPLISDQRAFIQGHRFMAAALAVAQAEAGRVGEAQATLALLRESSGQMSDIEQADAASVPVAIALAGNDPAEAARWHEQARAKLRKAVPSPSYETWHSRLVQARLNRQQRAIEVAQGRAAFGPELWAWLEADRTRTDAAYQQVAATYPGTLAADAATIERARLRLESDEAKPLAEAMRLLEDRRLLSGPLGAWASLTYADAALLAGAIPALQASLSAAMERLAAPTALPAEPTPAQRDLLVPKHGLHRLNERGRPRWEQRPTGAMLLPAVDPSALSWLRTQVVIRQAVLARVKGQKAVAKTLAQSLAFLDEAMRESEARSPGTAGCHILADMLATNRLLVSGFDAGVFDVLPPAVQLRIHMGLAAYPLYDYAGTERWMRRALAATDKSPRVIRDGVRLMLGCGIHFQRRPAEAMPIYKAITLPPGEPANWAWISARWGEMQCTQHLLPGDYLASTEPLLEIVRRFPQSDDGQHAWLAAAGGLVLMHTDQAERLARAYLEQRPRPPTYREGSAELLLKEIAEIRAKRAAAATTAAAPATPAPAPASTAAQRPTRG